MHPDLMLDLSRLRVQESLRAAEHHQHRHRQRQRQRQRQRRPRPPSRLRRDIAALLMHLAERLADEPVVNLPRAVGGENARAAR